VPRELQRRSSVSAARRQARPQLLLGHELDTGGDRCHESHASHTDTDTDADVSHARAPQPSNKQQAPTLTRPRRRLLLSACCLLPRASRRRVRQMPPIEGTLNPAAVKLYRFLMRRLRQIPPAQRDYYHNYVRQVSCCVAHPARLPGSRMLSPT